MGVGRPDCFLLQQYGEWIRQAFGATAYHVGSSLMQKRGWRDVDVRLLLEDDEFKALFGDPMQPGWDAPKLHAQELAWSEFGRRFTGLPIDFQIQQMTLANAEYPGPRGALRLTHRLIEARAQVAQAVNADDLLRPLAANQEDREA